MRETTKLKLMMLFVVALAIIGIGYAAMHWEERSQYAVDIPEDFDFEIDTITWAESGCSVEFSREIMQKMTQDELLRFLLIYDHADYFNDWDFETRQKMLHTLLPEYFPVDWGCSP